jgi:hypothetical protein
MSLYTEYFLKTNSSVVQLELLEISHPNFTQTFYIVRNAVQGLADVVHEDSTHHAYVYYPLRITLGQTRDNLDTSLKIDLGDLGQVLPLQLDAVAAAGGYSTKPTVKYRTYRHDVLTAPLFGPIELEVTSFSFNRDGATFEAKAPSLNVNKTGETYTLDRFPMLRGFL